MRTLGTLIAPTSGSAVVAGIPLPPENAVDIRRRIAVMPQSPGLYLRLSVAENLECFADLYEARHPRERIDSVLRSVRLADRAHEVCGACVRLFADPAVASALLRWPQVFAQVLFTPLISAWSIWIGTGISAKTNDLTVSQQLGILAGLPTVIVTSLVAFDVIHPTLALALGAAAALLFLDVLGRRIVSPAFNRERLITGTRWPTIAEDRATAHPREPIRSVLTTVTALFEITSLSSTRSAK